MCRSRVSHKNACFFKSDDTLINKHLTFSAYYIFSAEREGSGKSLDSVQDLLQEAKGENSQLVGKLHAAESQIEGLKKGKEEVCITLSDLQTYL